MWRPLINCYMACALTDRVLWRALPPSPGGRVEAHFPISTMDIMPTVLDILGLDPPGERTHIHG